MFRALIVLMVFTSCAAMAERPALSMGAGFEARMQRELNPDYVEMKSLGQLFVQARFEKWAVHAEVGDERRVSNAGGLKITARSINTGVWGRYQFVNIYRWVPFVGAGLGAYFDQVSSKFGAADDDRSGIRPYLGTGIGVSGGFWKYLLLEAEGRLAVVRDRKDPMASAILRAGVYF